MIMLFGKESESELTNRKQVQNTMNDEVYFFTMQPDGFSFHYSKGRDLLWHEILLSEIMDGIIIFLESPGSFAELGSFVLLKKGREKIMVCLEEQYKNKESYINLGPISYLGNNSNKNHLSNKHLFIFKPKLVESSVVISVEDAGKLLRKIKRKIDEKKTKNSNYSLQLTKNGYITFKYVFYFLMSMIHVLRSVSHKDLKEIFHNFIEFHKESKEEDKDDKFNILYVGNMEEDKLWPTIEESFKWIIDLLWWIGYIKINNKIYKAADGKKFNSDNDIFSLNFSDKNLFFDLKIDDLFIRKAQSQSDQKVMDEWMQKYSQFKTKKDKYE